MSATKGLITTAVIIPLLSAGFAHAQTNWRTFGFDRQRTGYNPEEAVLSPQTVPSLQLKWSIDLGAPMTGQPVEMNGIVYEGTWGGEVWAIDAASGSVIWAKQLGTASTDCENFAESNYTIGVIHTISTDLGSARIYAISGDGLLHTLDSVTGTEWPGYPIQVIDPANIGATFVWGSPLYSYENGSLYLATASGCDEPPYHGQIIQADILWSDVPQVVNRWTTTGADGPSGGGIWGYGGISFDGSSMVFAATGNALADPENFPNADAVVGLDMNLNLQAANSPADLSKQSADWDFGATPVLYQPPGCPAQLAAMNKNGALYVYNQSTINSGPIQELQIATGTSFGQFVGLVAYDPVFNQIYVRSTSDDGVGYFSHGIIALAVQSDCTLGLKWQQQIGFNGGSFDNASTPPVAANGVVYAATGVDCRVYAFDAASGRPLWDSGGLIQTGIYASPMVVNGQLFVAGFDHKLYAFGLP